MIHILQVDYEQHKSRLISKSNYFGTNSKNEQEKIVVMTFKFYLFLSNIAFIDFVYFYNEWVIDSIQPTLNHIPKITEWRSKLYACTISISAKSKSFDFQKL